MTRQKKNELRTLTDEERMWLELADDTLLGCPVTSTATGSAAADLITHWGRTAAGDNLLIASHACLRFGFDSHKPFEINILNL